MKLHLTGRFHEVANTAKLLSERYGIELETPKSKWVQDEGAGGHWTDAVVSHDFPASKLKEPVNG